MSHPTTIRQLSGKYNGFTYRDSGEGFPVVLLHGFPMDGSLWNAQVAALQQELRLLVPDLPGSGASPLLSPLDMETMADMVHAMLMQEGITSCILIGHSMGGYVSLAFAEKYPDLLKGWGLFHSTALPDSDEKKESRLKSVALMETYGSAAFLRQMMPGMFGEAFRKTHPEALKELIKERSGMPVESLAAYYHAMRKRPDRRAVLEHSAVPVLFILGKEDNAAPLADVLPQVALPQISVIHIFDHIAHMGMLELSAKTSVKILKDFIGFCLQKS